MGYIIHISIIEDPQGEVRNYQIDGLELTTAVFALKIWSHYLYGVTVGSLLVIKVLSTYSLKRT